MHVRQHLQPQALLTIPNTIPTDSQHKVQSSLISSTANTAAPMPARDNIPTAARRMDTRRSRVMSRGTKMAEASPRIADAGGRRTPWRVNTQARRRAYAPRARLTAVWGRTFSTIQRQMEERLKASTKTTNLSSASWYFVSSRCAGMLLLQRFWERKGGSEEGEVGEVQATQATHLPRFAASGGGGGKETERGSCFRSQKRRGSVSYGNASLSGF
mmetsp:Transcript_18875/g.44776  ORF Transcript_18875/g.44776 Transcript_18875/m.44776 type:complete len:215 (-) Transcript_18875:78-722(-)